MYYKYYFCERSSLKLLNFLKANNIKYSPKNVSAEGELISFSVLSNSEKAEEILQKCKGLNLGFPIVSTEYSKIEIDNAAYLMITPKKQCIDIINKEDAYDYACQWKTSVGVEKANHATQIALFQIKKEPSSVGKTAFWTEDTGFAELFTDYRVYELVKKNNLTGVSFKNVVLKNGDWSKRIFQIGSKNVINQNCIGKGHGEQKKVCYLCGKEQYVIDNTYQLYLDCSESTSQSDLYITERIFGEGLTYPLYIISQKFYQLLKQNKLNGGIVVSPVKVE